MSTTKSKDLKPLSYFPFLLHSFFNRHAIIYLRTVFCVPCSFFFICYLSISTNYINIDPFVFWTENTCYSYFCTYIKILLPFRYSCFTMKHISILALIVHKFFIFLVAIFPNDTLHSESFYILNQWKLSDFLWPFQSFVNVFQSDSIIRHSGWCVDGFDYYNEPILQHVEISVHTKNS